jgi:hypothetical protein
MHNSFARWAAAASLLFLPACSSTPARHTTVYQAGEKAAVDKLTYAVIDSQIHPRLGDDPANPRVPENRFYAVQIAISSGASEEVPIPAMTLVDDSGKTYSELADGSGLSHWLGVVRRVSPAQTERGEVLFDAPAAHYKLRLTDENDKEEVYIDLPLNFVHEQMGSEAGTPDIANPATGGAPRATTRPAQKK